MPVCMVELGGELVDQTQVRLSFAPKRRWGQRPLGDQREPNGTRFGAPGTPAWMVGGGGGGVPGVTLRTTAQAPVHEVR